LRDAVAKAVALSCALCEVVERLHGVLAALGTGVVLGQVGGRVQNGQQGGPQVFRLQRVNQQLIRVKHPYGD